MAWKSESVARLHTLIAEDNLTYQQAADQLNKEFNAKFSKESCRKKFNRTDWDAFKKNPLKRAGKGRKKWSSTELLLLHEMRTKEHPVPFPAIGKALGRTSLSCEKKFKKVNWSEGKLNKLAIASGQESGSNEIIELAHNVESLEKHSKGVQLAHYMIELSRHDLNRLEEIDEEFLIQKTDSLEELPIPFSDIKRLALKEMSNRGYYFEEGSKFKEGTYIIVGDSHGKHTKRGMFRLLNQVAKHVNPDNIFHIGHALDDDNDISYLWQDFGDKFVLVSKKEELKTLMNLPHEYNIIRNGLKLGNLEVWNQDLITDYVLRPVGNLSPQDFPYPTIINCHRQEMEARTTSGDPNLIMSPGCVCEEHKVKTIKQIDFTDGYQIKSAMPDSFQKYRRMDHTMKYWQQGLIIVYVDKHGNFTPICCRIKKINGKYCTSIFDKIITETGIVNPDRKISFHADAHCPYHDPKVHSLIGEFCNDFRPDDHVNAGDHTHNKSLNHWEMDRYGDKLDYPVLEEAAENYFLMKQTRRWAKNYHYVQGNHERWYKDFYSRFPQLKTMLNPDFMLNLESLNINAEPLKGIIELGPVKVIHGDHMMVGSKGGGKNDKIANVFGRNTISGHGHFPSQRFDCYTLGLSGNYEMYYNEPNAQRWVHGFGFATIYKGEPFITNVVIDNYSFCIDEKWYSPDSEEEYIMPEFEAKLSFEYAV